MENYLAECVGTAILVWFGNGVVANVVLAKSKAEGGGWIVIALGWGLAVALAVYAVGRISGAHINPAVTVGLASIGAFDWVQVPGYIISQFIGAMIGAALVYIIFYAHWSETESADAKRACFCTSPAIRRKGPAFVTETLGTAALLFLVLALGKVALGAETDELAWTTAVGTWFGPLLVGLLVLAIGISFGGPTGYAINPARDMGPRIVHFLLPIPGKGSSDWSYAWIPIAAPLLGGVLGAQLFILLNL